MTEQLNNEEVNDVIINKIQSTKFKDIEPRKKRFPLKDGVERLVTLVSNIDGNFFNIGFEKGKPNTIYGNIADRILDNYPNNFVTTHIDGEEQHDVTSKDFKTKLKEELKSELLKDFDMIPKNKNMARNRPLEKDILNSTPKSDKYKVEET
jgi:hypothetical protein